jgi:hypothetical protein
MDADRLPALLRSWSNAPTRRDLTRALTGTVLAAPLATLCGTWASDAKKKRKNKKGKGKRKKRCKGGETRCDGRCVDLETHVQHCGECDNACDPGQRCLFGECVDTCSPVCAAPQACCVDECLDLTSEAQHCGQCFHACAENEVCRFANCGCLGPRCPAGGANQTRCCPDANGTCCPGGGCCPNNGVCVGGGRCCDAGRYLCPGTDVCCPEGWICSGFTCVFPEREGAVSTQQSVPAMPATRAL